MNHKPGPLLRAEPPRAGEAPWLRLARFSGRKGCTGILLFSFLLCFTAVPFLLLSAALGGYQICAAGGILCLVVLGSIAYRESKAGWLHCYRAAFDFRPSPRQLARLLPYSALRSIGLGSSRRLQLLVFDGKMLQVLVLNSGRLRAEDHIEALVRHIRKTAPEHVLCVCDLERWHLEPPGSDTALRARYPTLDPRGRRLCIRRDPGRLEWGETDLRLRPNKLGGHDLIDYPGRNALLATARFDQPRGGLLVLSPDGMVLAACEVDGDDHERVRMELTLGGELYWYWREGCVRQGDRQVAQVNNEGKDTELQLLAHGVTAELLFLSLALHFFAAPRVLARWRNLASAHYG